MGAFDEVNQTPQDGNTNVGFAMTVIMKCKEL